MSSVSTSLTTRLRTWLLLAVLTGLLIAIGGLIGGTFLYLFVALAVVMNVAGYWFSDTFALRTSGAQPVVEADAPQLYADVRDLAVRAGLPMPRLYVIPAAQPNAFATGRNAMHAAVAVTEGLLRDLPADQVRGVLAHELAHIRNRDILVASIAAMVAGAIAAIANILQFQWLFGGDDDENPLGVAGTLAFALVAPLGATLIQLGISRQREYLADATAAQLLGTGRPLANALETLARKTEEVPLGQVNPATASLYIANPFPGQVVASLFSTHPPTAERILRLEVLEMSLSPGYMTA
jgi:heat shock protein HtpX